MAFSFLLWHTCLLCICRPPSHSRTTGPIVPSSSSYPPSRRARRLFVPAVSSCPPCRRALRISLRLVNVVPDVSSCPSVPPSGARRCPPSRRARHLVVPAVSSCPPSRPARRRPLCPAHRARPRFGLFKPYIFACRDRPHGPNNKIIKINLIKKFQFSMTLSM